MAEQATNLDEVYQFAIDLARRAGKEIAEASEKRWQTASNDGPAVKTNAVDVGYFRVQAKIQQRQLVTETDQRVERLVIDAIKERYPTHKSVGEESYAAGEGLTVTEEPTWIVDPIDGTTNFIHCFPACCISIAFCDGGLPVIGVVFNPLTDQLFRACKGNGAFCNDRRLPLSHPHSPLPLHSLGDALIGVEMGNRREKSIMDKKLQTFARLAGDPKSIDGGAMCHSLRMTGSAALNCCLVAAGSLDIYWEIGCYSWDVAAGKIIAEEAGGKMFGKNGAEFTSNDLSNRHYFVIRKIGDTADESGENAQNRICREFHSKVAAWEV